MSGGVANAGWNDQFTLTGGSGTGIWVVPILVDGRMDAAGSGARGIFEVGVYRNFNRIDAYGGNTPAYNTFLSLNTTHNGAIYYGWGTFKWSRSAWWTMARPTLAPFRI